MDPTSTFTKNKYTVPPLKCYKMPSVASQYLDYRPRVHTVQREGHLVLVRLPGPGRHLALLPLPVLAAQLRVLLLHVLLGDVQQHGLGTKGAPTCELHHDTTKI